MEFLVYLTTFLIPFYFLRLTLWGVPTNVWELGVVFSALYLVYELAFRCLTLGIKRHLGSIWHYLFLLSALAGVVMAKFDNDAIGILKGWFVVPFIYFLVATNVLTRAHLPKLSLSLFFSAILVSLWAVGQKLGVIDLLFYQVGDASFSQYLTPVNFRAFGPFESPNYLAMFLLPAMYLSLPALSVSDRTIYKVLIGVLFVFPLLALYLSDSLGGLAALSITAVIGVCLTKTGRMARDYLSQFWRNFFLGLSYLLKVALVVTLVGFLYYSIPEAPLSRPVFGTESSRIEIWQQSLNMLKSHWLAGVGLGQFFEQISAITVHLAGFQRYVLPYALHPHNLYLAIWLNLGLFGLLAFIGVLVSFLRIWYKNRSWVGHAPLLAIFAILIHGLVDTTYFKNDLSALFWLALVYVNLPQDELKRR